MPFGLISKKKAAEQRAEQERETARLRAEANAATQQQAKMSSDLEKLKRQEYQRREAQRLQTEQDQQRLHEETRLRQQQAMAARERENQRLARLRQTNPESLRHLRDLIRARYKADLYIWSLRSAKTCDQEVVLEEGVKADGILNEIYNIVGTWQVGDWSVEEWKVAGVIREQLFNSSPRVWKGNPPWNEGF